MKKAITSIFIALLILVGSVATSQATVQETDYSDIARYLNIYGYDLPSAVIEKMRASYVPKSADCGEVQVFLNEILYDGRWLYTSASMKPSTPDTVLVMPGGAQMGDSVSGLYQEGQRKDNRSFQKAAVEDGKRLLCVYAYPKEFDGLSTYFMDYLQGADGQPIMLSGVCLISADLSLAMHWLVQIYEVDTTTGANTLINEYEYPTTVVTVGDATQKNYHMASKEPLPFDSITLIRTGLTSYAYANWYSEDSQNLYEFSLSDAEKRPIPEGAPPDVDTYAMNLLPDQLYITLLCYATGEWSDPVLFSATDP